MNGYRIITTDSMFDADLRSTCDETASLAEVLTVADLSVQPGDLPAGENLMNITFTLTPHECDLVTFAVSQRISDLHRRRGDGDVKAQDLIEENRRLLEKLTEHKYSQFAPAPERWERDDDGIIWAT